MPHQYLDNITPLLPLRALQVTLRFTAHASFEFFHQAALHAFIRTLAGSPDKFDSLIMLDAPESGRSDYGYDDEYCFSIFGLPGSEILLEKLINKLIQLPHSCTVTDRNSPLRNNTRLVNIKDLLTEKVIISFDELSIFNRENLQAEINFWQQQEKLTLRILSPIRILKDSQLRKGLKGESRFCRDNKDLNPALVFTRLHDTLREQLKHRNIKLTSSKQTPDNKLFTYKSLFWLDSKYTDKNGNKKPFGGMMGLLELNPELLDEAMHAQLVFGQYLAMGQLRSFGLGRYQLETSDHKSSLQITRPAKTINELAADTTNTYEAYQRIKANSGSNTTRPERRYSTKAEAIQERIEEEWWKAHYPDLPDPDEEERLADKLEEISTKLIRNDYQAPYLKGIVTREDDGDLRGLAIPPFWDRVTQRAISQQITPALDKLMNERSYGYRKGRSRKTASFDIQAAQRQGYQWVYEADIEDYFDNINWQHLEIRLHALYRNDPVIPLIMNWIKASVDYQGFKIKRQQGLPQGGPISPVMANIMLDDFDEDMTSAGFRMVRYADDFVILCKKKEDAEKAAIKVRQSLTDLGLELNPGKTGIVSFEQGFKFLGYLFMNDLIIDISGTKDDKPVVRKAPSAPPPNSWMAKLGKRQAIVIEDFTTSKPEKKPAKVKKHLALGERKTGTLLIISGYPALITTQDGHIIATRDDETIADLSLNGLSALLLLGNHHITTPAIRNALKHDVPIHFASRSGFYQGVTWNGKAATEGITLWQRQTEIFNDPKLVLRPARQLIMARIRHMREVLRQRNPIAFYEERRILQNAMSNAGKAQDIDSLHGIEGNATRIYFRAIKTLIPKAFGFTGRNRRPPRDPFNALLSLGYTYLYAHMETLLRVDGFYPWKGVYHQSHGRHAALASDLMEPFRHLIERVALNMITLGQLKPDDFKQDPTKGCRLTPVALKKYYQELYKRFDTPLKMNNQQAGDTGINPLQQIHLQNLRLNNWLRGGETFKVWLMR